MLVLPIFSLAVAITLLDNTFAVDALVPNARRELPIINATRTLDTHLLGPSQSSSTTNLSRALITLSPVLNSTSSGNFKNTSFSICSAIAASRQGRPFKRNAGNELLPDGKGSHVFKRDARNCDIDGITVQLVYFPTSTTNASHPSTLFVSDLNKTFTSPSVYMLWQSITAHDLYFRTTYQFANATKTTSVGPEMITCVYSTSTKIRESSTSRIGPVLTKIAHPFDLSQLSTYDLTGFGMSSVMDYVQFMGSIEDPEQDPENPFTYKRMGLTAPSSQLQLSHLYTNCPQTLDKKTPPITRSNGSAVTDEDEDYFSLLNVKNHDHFRCNPFIGIPDFKWLDEPSWKSCSIKFAHRYWGMPDPPHALEFDPGLTPTVTMTPPAPDLNPKDPVTTQAPAAPIPVGSPGLAPNTSPATRPHQPVQTNTPPVQPDRKPESQPNIVPKPGNIEHGPANGGSNGGNNVQPETKPPPGSLEHHPSDEKADSNNQKPGDNPAPGNVSHDPSSGGVVAGNNAQLSNNNPPGGLENSPSDSTVGTNNGQPGSSGTMGGANEPGKPSSDNQDAKPNPGSNPASNKFFLLPGNFDPGRASGEANKLEPGTSPSSNSANPVKNNDPSNQDAKPNLGSNPAPKKVHSVPGNVGQNPSSGMPGKNNLEPGKNPPQNLANSVENASPSNQDLKSNSGGNPNSLKIPPSPGQESPVSAVSVAVIGTEAISALPSQNGGNAGGFIIPKGSTINSGSVTTLPPNLQGGQPIIYSVNAAGNLVVSSLNSPTGTTITQPLPPPSNARKEDSMITPLGHSNTVVYMGQTLTKGGAVATISALHNAVLTYGPLGVIVQYPNGVASTIPVTGTRNEMPATTRAGNDGNLGPLADKRISGSASLDAASKSSFPGQMLSGKPTSTTSSTRASSTRAALPVQYTGGVKRNDGSLILCIGLGTFGFIAGY